VLVGDNSVVGVEEITPLSLLDPPQPAIPIVNASKDIPIIPVLILLKGILFKY
jgi:hypothetical protein